jgi:small subunit ribosomal protein S1
MMNEIDQGNMEEENIPSMWDYLSDSYDFAPPSRGDVREGLILSLRPDQILVDIGGKHDAIVSPRELQRLSDEEWQSLRVGESIKVYVLRSDAYVDQPIVSIKLAQEHEDWQRAQDMMDSGDIVHSTVTGFNKGGLLCTFGTLQGFIPISQIADFVQPQDKTPMDVLGRYVGREMAIKVIEVNRRRRRLILSERAAAREWRAHQRERLMQEITEGQVRRGRVSNLVDFGAFVDLGGIDGLVHISELSWGRVEHPREVLEPGQEIDVLVLNVDHEKQRIGLSLKRTLKDPWTQATEKYTVGSLVEGTVTHIVSFGAFVELEPGIEGLVHVSELADGNIGDPSNVVNEGDRLALVVLGVDADQHRISLSLKQAPTPEQPDEENEQDSDDEMVVTDARRAED